MHHFCRLFVCCCLFPVFTNAQTFNGSGGAIPDDGSIIVFDINVSGLPNTLDTLNFGIESICLNATHTWDSDLSFSLRAPDGKVIPLFFGHRRRPRRICEYLPEQQCSEFHL